MKVIHILNLLLFITSCAPSGDLVKSTFQIEKANNLTKSNETKLKNQILERLDRYNFSDVELTVEGDKMTVLSRMDMANEKQVSTFKTLFKSCELGFWNTYRYTDPIIMKFDSSKIQTNNFQNFRELGIGSTQLEVLGVCADETKLDEVLEQLSIKTQELKNLKLVWSKDNDSRFDSYGKKNFRLYMINTKGKNNAVITGNDIKELRSNIDQYSLDWLIDMTLKEKSVPRWTDLTEKAAYDNNRAIAILINDRVFSAPRVNHPIVSPYCSITGNFNETEAKELVTLISNGKLDYTLKLLNQEKIVE